MNELIPQKEVKEIERTGVKWLQKASEIEVNNEDDAEIVSDYIKEIVLALRGIEEKRTAITQPLNLALREANSMFKKLSEPLENVKVMLGAKIMSWRTAENKKIQAEEDRRRKIQEAHAEKGHEVSDPVELARVPKTVGTVTTRKIWKFEVTEFADVPDNYKAIDRVAVMDAIRMGERSIKGLRIFEEEVLATKVN